MGDAMNAVYLVDLQDKREARGLTRAQAAALLGIHEQHLYRIEKGRSGISLDLALRCAKEFGTLRAWSPWGEFLIVPEALLPPAGDGDQDSIALAGSRRRVRRPKGVGIPVKCLVTMREVGQLDAKLREIQESILDVEMGRPGAETRLTALVKEAQEAAFWISTLLIQIGERYPDVFESGTDLAVDELRDQIGEGAEAA